MTGLWVLLAVTAAFLQNFRNALQKALTRRVSVLGATYARFVFAAPWAVLLVVGLISFGGQTMPRPTVTFAIWSVGGAFGQIAGTLLLLHLFSLRNFAVGNTLAKTETVQAALFGYLLLGDLIAPLALVGILVSLCGVALLSAVRDAAGAFSARAVGIGVAAGAAFAFSGVAYRAAALALDAPPDTPVLRAAATLAFVTVLQTLLLTIFMNRRVPGEVGRVFSAWRVAVPVGVAGMIASFSWFAAFAMVSAAQVKAVGQIELVFSYLTARIIFGEHPSFRETLGILLVSAGIILLVLTPHGNVAP
ncbi:EamA family transporter [Rhodobacteraceae bacterium DSL-40]|uniref:EamA family transporter n=1 Tax=Amaricoccus sp. B4 TaxID=3368557 RepID=UPI0013A6E5D2